MGNRVSVQVCKFTDFKNDGSVCDEHWGVRIFDDFDQQYNNMLGESFKEVMQNITPINRFLYENFDGFYTESLNRQCIYLNGDLIDFEEFEED